MSKALYDLGGLRFWSERELETRNLFQQRIVRILKDTLIDMNKAWTFHQVEGPVLSPQKFINPNYTDKDLFVTNHDALGAPLCLRPETTATSYAYARHLNKPLPVCIWQAGKSFRRELNDGASAAKLRFNEFWQLEFQCIYAVGTKANYRTALIEPLRKEIERFTNRNARVVSSDRLPSYSTSTQDIEVKNQHGWTEVASCSLRNDFSNVTEVCEIAIGLDRIVDLSPT